MPSLWCIEQCYTSQRETTIDRLTEPGGPGIILNLLSLSDSVPKLSDKSRDASCQAKGPIDEPNQADKPHRMHVMHIAVAGRTLAVVERDDAHDPATGRALTGSWLWDSALVLVSHLASASANFQQQLRGATVLELGAGTGLPGIAAVVCLGAERCVLTDVRPLLPGLRANAEANGLTPAQADVRELRWGEYLQLDLLQVDVVLMSDVFYDPEDMPAMAATLRGLWRDGDRGTVGLAASEVRDGVHDCVDVLREHGFEVAEVDRVNRPLLRDPAQTAAFAIYRVERRHPRGR